MVAELLGGGLAGPLVGGTIGAGVGAIGGLISGFAQRAAANDLRKQIRGGILGGQADTARQVAGIVGSREYLTGSNFIRGIFGIQGDARSDLARQLEGIYGPDMFGTGVKQYDQNTAAFNKAFYGESFGAQALTDRRLSDAQAALEAVQREGLNGATSNQVNSIFGIGGKELKGWGQEGTMQALQQRIATLTQQSQQMGARADEIKRAGIGPLQGPGGAENAPMDVLSQEFSSRIQQAQMSRGLYSSQAGAAAEASGMAAFKANMQMQLLPQLMKLASAPQDYANSLELQNLGKRVQFASGGQAVYGQANAGAADVNPWAMAAQGAAAGFSGGAGVGLSAQQYMQSRPQQQPDYGTPLQPSPMQYSIFGR
jgi:hypothetical protein